MNRPLPLPHTLRRCGWCVPLILLLMMGCRSPEPTYVTLEPLPPQTQRHSEAAGPVAVGELRLPPEVDRQRLVTRKGTHRVDPAPSARWAAPLEELVRSALRNNLADRLPAEAVAGPAQRLDRDAYVVTVAFETFSCDAEGGASLDATWRLLDAEGRSLVTRTAAIRTPAAGDAPRDAARAMSTALAELADRIATEIAARADDPQ